jgi:hypothetical protein
MIIIRVSIMIMIRKSITVNMIFSVINIMILIRCNLIRCNLIVIISICIICLLIMIMIMIMIIVIMINWISVIIEHKLIILSLLLLG